MLRGALTIICAVSLAWVPATAQEATAPASWSASPWQSDLAAIRAALLTKYANLDWLRTVRAVDLDAVFAQADAAIETAGSDDAARRIIDRMLARFKDGHVQVDWSNPTSQSGNGENSTQLCSSIGFTDRPGVAVGVTLPGFRPLPWDGIFAAGTVTTDEGTAGLLRISEFQPHGTPALCHEVARALAIAEDKPFDEACQDRLLTEIYVRYTRRFADRIGALRDAGATTLIIDLTDNGGGSEWAEAAARMVAPGLLISERLAFVRGEHWARHWRELASDLKSALAKADREGLDRLRQWIEQAETNEREAMRRCEGGTCNWLGEGGHATGLVGGASAKAFRGKPWGPLVLSPAQYEYADGQWDGPLIVLVNDETWSAAEEFAALLQDNRAALIVGARTGGAGCGHTNGGTPTTLPRSGGVLQLPDCARLRADGSNEINGVVPDLLLPWRASDRPAYRAAMLMPHLDEAIRAARALRTAGRPSRL